MENLFHSRIPNRPVPSLQKDGSNGGSSFDFTSSKAAAAAYDEVFGGPGRFGSPMLSPLLEDYFEIFGECKRSSRTAFFSIPMLDLPSVDEREVCFDIRSQGFNYLEVFGGFDHVDFAPSYEEMLMKRSEVGDRNDDSSDEAWTPEDLETTSAAREHSSRSPCFSNKRDSYEFINGCTELNISKRNIESFVVNGDTNENAFGRTVPLTCCEAFVTVSDISLKTQPSKIPPPSRAPPLLPWDSTASASNCISTESERSVDGYSPSLYDVNAAAMIQEAVEKTQTRLREKMEKEWRMKEACEKAENERRLKVAIEQEEKEQQMKEARVKEENELINKEAREKAELESKLKEAIEQEERKEDERRVKQEQEEKEMNDTEELEEKERKLREAFTKAESERREEEATEREERERKQRSIQSEITREWPERSHRDSSQEDEEEGEDDEEEREREREKDRMGFDQRAMAAARERLEKAVAEAHAHESREQMETSLPIKQFRGSASFGADAESPRRYTSRLERHNRTSDRVARALSEKNIRDVIAQREEAERNRLAETLDADIERWSSGKAGNIRALLSTLQYIVGEESGWQAIPMTEVITPAAVKKAYRKATLCLHPDKLQQRAASIHHKYVCEKVFDLLKEAWNRFNSDES